jgi:multicomponent Na+:H+ antiporter subunit E
MKAGRVFLKFLALFAFWILLSGHVNIAESTDRYLLTFGAVACGFVAYVSVRKKILGEGGPSLRLIAAGLLYIPWLFKEIVLANWDVALRVWQPSRGIAPRLFKVPFRAKADLPIVVYANSITLTPGTVSVEVDSPKGEILVHGLTEDVQKDLLSGRMHDRIEAVGRS